jgi:hypothetical protein
MTAADLPAPLTTTAIDLDGMPSFMLDTEQLRQSELWAISTGDEFKAAVGLWCRAWLQKPPGSLPNDDRVLASWSGSKRWSKVREVALRGFILCSDGRLYHPVLCADALRAWERRSSYRDKASNAAAVRWAKHKHAPGMPQALPEHCPSTARAMPTDAQREREGERELQGENTSEADVTPASPFPADSQTPIPTEPPTGNDSDLWRYRIGAEPWARTLKRAGCKIGPNNWRAWKGLIERAFACQADACAAAAAKVKPEDRWPDQVEAAARTEAPSAIASKYADRQARIKTVQVTP